MSDKIETPKKQDEKSSELFQMPRLPYSKEDLANMKNDEAHRLECQIHTEYGIEC